MMGHILPFGGETSEMLIQDDETIEDLQLKGYKLIQKKNGFRFGMDSVLLAYFADIKDRDIVADFGTGNGVLPILLHGRNKGDRYYAIEIQKEAADLALRNMKMNKLTDTVNIIHADVKNASDYIKSCSIDAVICNPPYSQPYASIVSPVKERAIARSQNEDTLNNILKSAFEILKGKGKIFIVYPVQHMLFIMKKMQDNHLEPKRFRLVYPNEQKKANLVLIEAVKDAKPALHSLPPLIIYQKDGSLTNELWSVYHYEK